VETVAGPVDVGVRVETELLAETIEVTIVVPFLLGEIVATEDATGAVVVALLGAETTPFPAPSEGVRPPDWAAVVAALDADAAADADADADAEADADIEAEAEAADEEVTTD
jgi:hypothetical protein